MGEKIKLYPFEPHPDIGLNKTDGKPVTYKSDYVRVMREIQNNPSEALQMIRWLVLNDLWFIAYFILPLPDNVKARLNHPFVVKYAREIQEGPGNYTLDLVAREHFKSTLITISETIQYVLKNPNDSNAIFSYTRAVAKRFLREIKHVFENDEHDGCRLLKMAFPDVLWKKPEKEAPKWSEDDGLIVKRGVVSRESTIEAWGLLEGMPTGGHFNRRIYDDIVTEDIAESPEIMEKVKLKFDSSQNLGVSEGGTHRVVGTIYAYDDPLCYIRDIINPETGKKAYYVRFKPATVDGMPNGKPVFLSQERLNELKLTKTFFCQQLLNPIPIGEARLNPDMLKEIEPEFIPNDVYKVMVIDPAGDQSTQSGDDSWAIFIFAVDPNVDDIGASNVYIVNAVIDKMSHSEAIETITRMYLSGGIIEKIAIEKVGLSSVEVHVSNALHAKGRRVSVDDGSIVVLKPAGRKKHVRIEQALSWPLNNGKIHISKSISSSYRERIKQEMRFFPRWSRDDALDAMAYLYDVLRDNRYIFKNKHYEKPLKYDYTGIA